MKRSLAILIASSLVHSSFGMIIWTFDAPHDDQRLREAALPGPAARALRDEFNEFQERRIWPITCSDIKAALGATMEAVPKDRVLPIFESTCVMLSGLRSRAEPDKSHADVYAIGDIGYLEVHYHQNGEKVETALLFYRPDADFVPLKALDNLMPRLDWELKKLKLAEKWLAQHLPK